MRQGQSRLAILREAWGSPWSMLGKLWRTGAVISAYARRKELDARLARLHALGLAEKAPTRIQLALGAWDMQRLYIMPASNEYHDRRGLDYAYCQLIRFVDNPVIMMDPLGLASPASEIIEHLVQSFHGHPTYDLQLLTAFEGGLEALEARLCDVISGTEARSAVSHFVNDDDYHQRLLAFLRAFRADPAHPPAVLEEAAVHRDAEEIFGTVTYVMRHCATRPKTLGAALLYLWRRGGLAPTLPAASDERARLNLGEQQRNHVTDG